MADYASTQKIHGHCALCIARCGTIATVEGGRFTRLDPDPSHPTGQAICAKGRAAPELVYHPERLTRPLRRTRPKGDADPGWVPISWDEALDLTAAAMQRIKAQHGARAVAFSIASTSTTAIGDSAPFVQRLRNAFGTPNLYGSIDVCGWGRGFATQYTFGVGSVALGGGAGAMADIANSGCLILWGYNPSFSRLTHATATVEALQRGMKLIVIDPRKVGLGAKADVWLRVRPGSDGALALGLANLMIRNGWYDRTFIQTWSNGPLLVRNDTGRLLSAHDMGLEGERRYFAWHETEARPVAYDAAAGTLRGGRIEPGAGRRVPDRDAARRGGLSSRVRALRRALPHLSAGSSRGDVLDSTRAARSDRPADLARRARSPTTPGAATSSMPIRHRRRAPCRCSMP